jgi:signal peptide peptidase SppA
MSSSWIPKWWKARGARRTTASLRREIWAMAPAEVEAIFEALADFGDREPLSAEDRPAYETRDGVAHIPIRGAIMREVPWIFDAVGIDATSTIETQDAIETALSDPDVSSIMLDVHSPGGAVSGVEELANTIAEASSSKPVKAHATMAASAAYWLASQAQSITASVDAPIGSIGVYSVVADSSAAAESAGVKVHVIKSGEHKGAGEPGSEVTDEQLAHIQERVNATAGRFASAVAKGRGLSPEQVADLADGRVWVGDDAQARGLVDEITTRTASTEAAATEVAAEKAKMDQNEKILERLAALEGQLTEAKAAQSAAEDKANQAEAKAVADAAALAEVTKAQKASIVQRGVTDGRIVGTQRAAVEAYASTTDVDALEVYVANLPVQTRPDRASEQPAAPDSGPAVSDEVAQIARITGAKPADVSLHAKANESGNPIGLWGGKLIDVNSGKELS